MAASAVTLPKGTLSPPSRAAWIEIYLTYVLHHKTESPPSRAAWIEIISAILSDGIFIVAAFTGGVD